MAFAPDDENTTRYGQVVDQASWQALGIVRYLPPSESMSTLNIKGPYSHHTEKCADQVEEIHLRHWKTQPAGLVS
jgi:hypothetical protein